MVEILGEGFIYLITQEWCFGRFCIWLTSLWITVGGKNSRRFCCNGASKFWGLQNYVRDFREGALLNKDFLVFGRAKTALVALLNKDFLVPVGRKQFLLPY